MDDQTASDVFSSDSNVFVIKKGNSPFCHIYLKEIIFFLRPKLQIVLISAVVIAGCLFPCNFSNMCGNMTILLIVIYNTVICILCS